MRKKTEIVLCNANLTALLSAFEALNVCFGKGLTFRESTIRQKDKESLDYEVDIWGKIPKGNLNSDRPAIFHAIVTFTLKKDVCSNLYFKNGPVEIKIFGNASIIKLKESNEKYRVSKGSIQSLQMLKEGIRQYYSRY